MKSRMVALAPYRPLLARVKKTDHRVAARWALACAARVLPWLEAAHPEEARPRAALDELRRWIRTGELPMKAIRKASLDAHAAARALAGDEVARSIARAAGQAVATAHVKTHSVAAAMYAATAVRDRAAPDRAEAAVERERAWQLARLSAAAATNQRSRSR